MEEYKNKCVFNFCILRKYLENNFPDELINLINYHYDKYIFICYLPYVCNVSGNYIVTKNLTCIDKVGILVNAIDVDIDLNSKSITGSHNNICVKVKGANCTIHDGTINNFNVGIDTN